MWSDQVVLGRDDRILVVAPHCDDEILGAGGLMHKAVQAGAAVYVVMLTNGDGYNRAALGGQSRRLRPSPAGVIAFAYARQQETLAALDRLGLDEGAVTFLGYPDRGLASMWERHWHPDQSYTSPFTRVSRSPYHNSRTPGAPFAGASLASDLAGVLDAFRPTHLVLPHPSDFHGDHWAGCCFTLFALEQLRLRGRWAGLRPRVLLYLVHQGPWPRPRGFHPGALLHPPPSFIGLRFPWLTLPLGKGTIAHKHDALLSYRSQMVFMRSYLLSFVRTNELFGTAVVLRPPVVPRGGFGADGEAASAWIEGEVLYPTRDSLARKVGRSADVRALRLARDEEYLYLQIELRHRAVDDYVYGVSLYGTDPKGDLRQRLHIGMRVPDRLHITGEGRWASIEGIQGRAGRRALDVAVPLAPLQGHGHLFVGAETRYRGLVIDRLALQLLDVG